jgi:ATP-dependent helicase STH1/SNF2
MFANAKVYNQEGSWVYVDAEQMERVFDSTYERVMAGSGLPGAPSGGGGSALAALDSPGPSAPRSRGAVNRRQVVSDEEYLTPSDED